MVGREEMHQFVDDDELAQAPGQWQQIGVEGEAARRRDGGPLAGHLPDVDTGCLDTQLCRPVARRPAQFLGILPVLRLLAEGRRRGCGFRLSW